MSDIANCYIIVSERHIALAVLSHPSIILLLRTQQLCLVPAAPYIIPTFRAVNNSQNGFYRSGLN